MPVTNAIGEEVHICIKVTLKKESFHQSQLAQSLDGLTTNLKNVSSSPTVN